MAKLERTRLLVFGGVVLSVIICNLLTIPVTKEDGTEEEIKHRIRGPIPSDDRRLVYFVKKFYMLPPSSESYNLSRPNEMSYRKSSIEDSFPYISAYLQRLFSDEPPGFFVEAGALDGEFLSNTLWLEQSKGWTGLLVEPDLDSFNHLCNKHRKAWISNTCLSTLPFPKKTIHVSQRIRKDTGTLGDYWNHQGSAHELGVDIIKKDSLFSLLSEEFYSVVQCFPLVTYLKALNVSSVDFLSLDIQGGEEDVLRSFPWDSVRIRVLAIESFENTTNHMLVDYMESKDYELVNKYLIPKVRDHIYVRKDETSLLEKSRKIAIFI